MIAYQVTKKGWMLHNNQGTQEAFDELEWTCEDNIKFTKHTFKE